MRSSIWILFVCCLLSGCDFRKEAHLKSSPPQEEVSINVFAAASLTEAFHEIADTFEENHTGVNVHLHFAGSQQLAQQIIHGAPADVFASANEAQMQIAIASGRIEAQSPKPFASNQLAVVLPHQNPASLNSIRDLARPEILLVLADELVPIGHYSRIFLDKVSHDLGESYKSRVLSNVASYEQNVRAVLTKVALGEADAGIVYASDLIGMDSVTPLEIPSHLNAEVSYPIAPLSDTDHPDMARAFTAFVHSPEGMQILAKYGLLSEVHSLIMPRNTPLRIGPSWWLMSLPLFLLLLLPLGALLLQSTPADIASNLSTPAAYQAITLSLKTSLISVILTVILGTPLAFVLARKDFPLHKSIETLIDLPMVLPPAVAGVALLIAFGRNGMIGQYLGLQIPFTQAAVIMAQIFVAAPLFIRSAIIGISRIDDELIEAAVLDGASTWQVLQYVTLPIAQPAFLGGAVLTWARALGEFGATIIFAGNLSGTTQTMPLAIYLGFEMDIDVAIALSVILMGTSFLVLVLVRYMMNR